MAYFSKSKSVFSEIFNASDRPKIVSRVMFCLPASIRAIVLLSTLASNASSSWVSPFSIRSLRKCIANFWACWEWVKTSSVFGLLTMNQKSYITDKRNVALVPYL